MTSLVDWVSEAIYTVSGIVWVWPAAMPLLVVLLVGTGLVTTAARAEMVQPQHLSTAIRVMSTLNREAAEVLHEVGPHAVTDVTGFGLVGHLAEMAEASGVAVEIDLGALPLLPGALQAAATGLVPAGAGKNRTSVAAVLEVDEAAVSDAARGEHQNPQAYGARQDVQRLIDGSGVELPVAAHLGVVAHPAQQAQGDPRRASGPAGDLMSALVVDTNPENPSATDDDCLDGLWLVEIHAVEGAETGSQGRRQ